MAAPSQSLTQRLEEEARREARRSLDEVARDLTLDIVALCNELIERLAADRRQLTCRLHPGSGSPTLCPICALVGARQRQHERMMRRGR